MQWTRVRPSLLCVAMLIATLASTVGCKARNAASQLRDDETVAGEARPEARPRAAIRQRMSIFDPANRANVEAYVRAFKTLQSTAKGRQVWEQLASIHENYCPHGNWFFLPWHRVYLHHFEKVIATVSGKADFALPYWDWDGVDRNRMPDATLAQAGLFWTRRSPQARSAQARLLAQNVGTPAMSRIMGATSFIAFGSGRASEMRAPASQGLLEAMPHNSTHVWVGGNTGDMASFMSPRDPIFWMHHCNVDRIWTSWTRKRQAAGRPTIPPNGAMTEVKTSTWLNFGLMDGFLESKPGAAEPTLQPVTRNYKVSDTFDSVATFGYDYDRMATGAAAASLVDEEAPAPELAQASTVPASDGFEAKFEAEMDLKLKQVAVFETTRAVVFVLDLDGSTGKDSSGTSITGAELLSRATAALRRGDGSEPSIEMFVDDVPIPRDPSSTRLEFYFNSTPGASPSRREEEFLGTFSFFGHDHHAGGGNHPTTTSVVFDLGHILKERSATIVGGNLFVSMFVRYTDENGVDVTDQRDLPLELKPRLKQMKLRVHFTEP